MVAIEGKSVLITGAARRMGRAIACALAAEGAHVVVHFHRSQEAAEALAAELRQGPGDAWTIQADLADSEQTLRMLQKAISETGGLDFLINNASIFPENSLSETDWPAIEENMRVNSYAPLLLCRAFAERGRPGAVVNLLDTMVADYDRKHEPYHLSKRMLHTLTRISAVEYAPLVRVNAVAPGLVLPPAGKDLAYLESLAHTNPLQRHGGAEDVAEAVVFLLKADFVTGQTIYVDGGRNIRGSMYE